MTGTIPLWRKAAAVIGKAADKVSPARERTSDERRAHLAAIAKILARWESGQISTTEKREQIAAENSFFYQQREHKSPATGEVITKAPPAPGPTTPAPEDMGRGQEDYDEDRSRWWDR